MIYQPTSSLNSSPVYPVDSSILECELNTDIHSAPNLLAEMNDQLFGASGVKIISYREIWNQRDACTCKCPTCKTMRSAMPATTPYQYAVFPATPAAELHFQMNYLLSPHFLTKNCIIHHNLLWHLILIRPFLKKGGL